MALSPDKSGMLSPLAACLSPNGNKIFFGLGDISVKFVDLPKEFFLLPTQLC